MKYLLAGLLLTLAAPLAFSHDVWVGTDLRILFGHPLQGAEGYPAERIVKVSTLTADGKAIPHTLVRDGESTVIKAGAAPALALVYLDNGFYSKTPDVGRFQPGKLADATEVKQFVKYGKTLFAWSPATAAPSGWGLELVPQSDPATLKPGAPLQLAVHYEGQRLPNAKVARYVGTEETVYSADADDLISVPFAPGENVIYTTRHTIVGTDGVDEVNIAGALMIAPR